MIKMFKSIFGFFQGSHAYKVLLAFMSVCLMMASCDKSRIVQDIVYEPDSALEFCSNVSSSVTKGDTPVNNTSLKSLHFGLFAYWEDHGDYFDGVDAGHLYLDNREVSYSYTEGGRDYWTCSPSALWPIGCTLTFFSYAPLLDTDGPMLKMPAEDTGTMLRGRFCQETDVTKQVDLCLSGPVYDFGKRDGAVPLSFTHSLSKVLFYFNLTGGKYDEETRSFMVKRLSVRDVVGENSFTYGGRDGYRWDDLPRSDLSLRNARYDLSIPDGTLPYLPLPYEDDMVGEEGLDKYVCVNSDEESILYLLPQPMTGSSMLTVTLSLYEYDSVHDVWVEDENGEMDPIVIYLPASTVWDAGRTICYSASVVPGISISFHTTLADWEGNVIQNVGFPVE